MGVWSSGHFPAPPFPTADKDKNASEENRGQFHRHLRRLRLCHHKESTVQNHKGRRQNLRCPHRRTPRLRCQGRRKTTHQHPAARDACMRSRHGRAEAPRGSENRRRQTTRLEHQNRRITSGQSFSSHALSRHSRLVFFILRLDSRLTCFAGQRLPSLFEPRQHRLELLG